MKRMHYLNTSIDYISTQPFEFKVLCGTLLAVIAKERNCYLVGNSGDETHFGMRRDGENVEEPLFVFSGLDFKVMLGAVRARLISESVISILHSMSPVIIIAINDDIAFAICNCLQDDRIELRLLYGKNTSNESLSLLSRYYWDPVINSALDQGGDGIA